MIVLTTISCDQELNLQPQQSLSTSESLSDYKGLQTALFGAYDGLQGVNYYGRDFVVIPEVGGDNVYVSVNNSNRFLANYNYQLTADNTQTGFWNQAYDIILRVNNIINNIDAAADATEAQRNQVLGEALVIRALTHFDLVRVFAKPYAEGGGSQLGVPIKLDDEINEPPRNTVGEVYNQVIADLTEARPLLTGESISADDAPFRFSANAVDALLARVHLYMGNNTAAETAATAVINSGDYTLVAGSDLSEFWNTTGNSEEIFTLLVQADETRGSDNLGQIYNPQGYGDIRVSQDVISLYDAADDRRDLFYQDGSEYYVGKFLGESGTPGLVSPKILRLAEMYLIRAEARAKEGDFSGAIADVNVIRGRANAPLLGAIPDNQVLDAVLTEKRMEFAFEGHRTFDLWRNGDALTRNQCNTGLELEAPCVIAADATVRIYPIPRREMDVNQQMIQNDGY